MLSLIVVMSGVLAGDGALLAGEVQLVSDSYTFSEGPLWLPEGKWVFSDVPEDSIFDIEGGLYRRPSHGANGLALDAEGRLLACESDMHRITRTEKDGSITVLAETYQGKPLNGTNDLVVRSDGTIFFTDPKGLRAEEESPLGFSGVFAIDARSGELRLIAEDFVYPNGIALSPDEATLYVSDTREGHIREFSVAEDGSLSSSRVLCEVRIPDGMAIDEEGRIWSSSSRGIVIFGADGQRVGEVMFKGMPTNCAFGGPDGKTLVITARKMVYRVACKVRGAAAAPDLVE